MTWHVINEVGVGVKGICLDLTTPDKSNKDMASLHATSFQLCRWVYVVDEYPS